MNTALFPVPPVRCTALNDLSAPFGLSFSPAQAAALQRQEAQALSHTGRICFGDSILPRLAAAFADSPHIRQIEWADTLGELTALFYALKADTEDRLSDEELIAQMVYTFNGPAQGDPTLLLDSFMEDGLDADDITEEDDDED